MDDLTLLDLLLTRMDLLAIYESFLRSNLEQSAAVWHSSLSKCNEFDLERVQKSALSDSR